MERYPDLVLMGQDIADYGGVFKITEGFVAEFRQGVGCAIRRCASRPLWVLGWG